MLESRDRHHSSQVLNGPMPPGYVRTDLIERIALRELLVPALARLSLMNARDHPPRYTCLSLDAPISVLRSNKAFCDRSNFTLVCDRGRIPPFRELRPFVMRRPVLFIAILIAQRQRFDRRTIDAAQLFRRLRTIRPSNLIWRTLAFALPSDLATEIEEPRHFPLSSSVSLEWQSIGLEQRDLSHDIECPWHLDRPPLRPRPDRASTTMITSDGP